MLLGAPARWIVWLRGLSWLAVVALLLAFVVTTGAHQGAAGVSTPVARPAPPFFVTTFADEPLSMTGLHGQPIVITFWASWSGDSYDQMLVSERVWQAYRQRGVAVVGFAAQEVRPLSGDPDHNARAFVKRLKLTFPISADRGDIASAYGVRTIPETFFIDATGSITRRYAGPISEAVLRQHVDELLTTR
jgi:cytochrome c biogenesis protein CcmG/thiol:disulfide interchange protein DsbE